MFLKNPARIRELIPTTIDHVVIDEFQKVPLLLSEVHWLIEHRGICFTLCGSSARQLKKTNTHLLGGRALKKVLHGFSGRELGPEFELDRLLTRGYLPSHYLSAEYRDFLAAYVDDYLTEEIKNEGLVRNLPIFSDFLQAASFSDGEIVNYSTIARDTGISGHTVREYFSILEDTMMGRLLPAYGKNPKRRTLRSPKFYFSNVGVVNHLAKRGDFARGSMVYGKAFENWVLHELTCYSDYSGKRFPLSYWRLTSGVEVDFVLGDMEVVIEAKASSTINSNHLKNLRELEKDFPTVKKAYVVCLEAERRYLSDRLEVLPYQVFLELLWTGQLI